MGPYAGTILHFVILIIAVLKLLWSYGYLIEKVAQKHWSRENLKASWNLCGLLTMYLFFYHSFFSSLIFFSYFLYFLLIFFFNNYYSFFSSFLVGCLIIKSCCTSFLIGEMDGGTFTGLSVIRLKYDQLNIYILIFHY